MKKFLVLYVYKGVPSMATCTADDAEDAKAQIAISDKVYVDSVIELAGTPAEHKKFIQTLIDMKGKGNSEITIQNMSDDDFMQDMRDKAAASDKQEQTRKAKFKKNQTWNTPDNLTPEKKKAILDTADSIQGSDAEFNRDLWEKLLKEFLTAQEQKVMQKEFEADAKAHWKSDKTNYKREMEVIRRIFKDAKGKWGGESGEAEGVLTFDQIATAWGCSKPYALKVYNQALAKVIMKLLKKDHLSDVELKATKDRIEKLNSDARKAFRDKSKYGSQEAAKEEKARREAAAQFKQLAKDIQDICIKVGIKPERYDYPTLAANWKKLHPVKKDVSLDAFEKPVV